MWGGRGVPWIFCPVILGVANCAIVPYEYWARWGAPGSALGRADPPPVVLGLAILVLCIRVPGTGP